MDKVKLERIATTLYRRTMPSGTQTWIQRLVINGRRTDMGLGSCELVTEMEASEKALANRKIAYNGGNPLATRASGAPTFGKAATETYETLRHGWKSEVTKKQFMAVLEKHALKRLGRMRVDKITQQDVLALVKPVLLKTPEQGQRLRRYIKQVLGWCLAHDYVPFNVADSAINSALPKRTRKHVHMRSLPYIEAPAAIAAMESLPTASSKLAFLFQIHTAARNQEARLATWPEMDLENGIWHVSMESMKEDNLHKVPLCKQAVEILRRAEALRDKSGLVFPSPQRQDSPLSIQAFHKCLKLLGLKDKTTVHGFRACFANWAVETGYDKDLADMALAHKTGTAVQQAYFTSTRFDERRDLMAAWSEYLAQEAQ